MQKEYWPFYCFYFIMHSGQGNYPEKRIEYAIISNFPRRFTRLWKNRRIRVCISWEWKSFKPQLRNLEKSEKNKR